MRRLVSYLSLFFLLIAQAAQSQYEASRFRLHSVKTGLSNNYVTCVEQDELGYMWIGTDDGLNRFDGSTFTHYTSRRAPLHMASGMIRNIKRLDGGRLALISRGGLHVIDTRSFAVDDYLIPDTTAFSPHRNAAWDAIELPDGSMALTTAAGFYVFDTEKRLVFRKEGFSLADVGRKRIFYGRYMLLLDPGHLSVFVGEHSLAHYDIKRRAFEEFSAGDRSPYNFFPAATAPQRGLVHHYALNGEEILFFHFADNSVVYYHARKGITLRMPLPVGKDQFNWDTRFFRLSDTVFAVTGGNSGFYTFSFNAGTGRIRFDTTHYLPEFKVLCLKRDSRGKLWIGTSQGLLQESESSRFISTHQLPAAADDPAGYRFSAVYRYKEHLFIGGNANRNGVVVVDAVSREVKKRLHFFSSSSEWNEVFSIERYHGDTLFIGTNAGIIWLDSRSYRYGKVEVPETVTTGLNILGPPGKDGYAWMCSLLNGIVARYHIASRSFTVFTANTKPALPFGKVKSIAYDSYGDVWIGGHSLARWNSRAGVFDTLITVYGGDNKFNEDIIVLNADKKGSLWMHSAENRLLEYRIKERRWVQYGVNEGLPTAAFHAISGVVDNRIWLASTVHLSCFDITTHRTVVYDIGDGYTEDGPKEKRIYADTVAGQMYLLAKRNLTHFPKAPVLLENGGSEILLQEVRINSVRSLFHPQGEIDLPYSENNLALYFSVIDYDNNHYRFQYRWKEGTEWISLNDLRSINLSGLPPGQHRLFLKAIGKWGALREREVRIQIGEPWWRTTVFLVSVLAAIALLVFLVYRYRVRQIKAWANLDRQLAHSEMMALHAQMNPHFISNSLNSIREMILNNENQDASRYLTKFAHLIRITLEHSLKPFVSLRHTMDYINRYAEMEMIRNAKFQFTQTVSPELDGDEVMLPPMLIQPFIENSIWHGAEAGLINIRVEYSRRGDQLVCVVEDDGIGIRQSLLKKSSQTVHHQSVGLENIRNRIHLLNEKYGMQSTVEIEDRSDKGERGTRVIIQLPIKTYE